MSDEDPTCYEEEEDDDDDPTCDECGGELTYVETKANGDLCCCNVCGHEQLITSDGEDDA